MNKYLIEGEYVIYEGNTILDRVVIKEEIKAESHQAVAENLEAELEKAMARQYNQKIEIMPTGPIIITKKN